ncbi:peroxiredoxin [Belnapia sp. F-4-1]|uniref:peroxiredoxin family protein n=1 Tax=Belnapia sp. F-4-1 TaxID=1545443 RepID=UPI0005BE792E|nr:TlpA disulfide reductase family protein [Belnapia sp. F-4-1]
MSEYRPQLRPAPPWTTAGLWLNTAEGQPLELAALRGRVVVALAFQMLCPGCVQYALPQLSRIRRAFHPSRVAVLGLHTVFEHHAANRPETLSAFSHEYRLEFPIGIDAPDPRGGPMPVTMAAYAMQGTPTLLIIDAAGRLRRQAFGHVEDIVLGADVALLAAEAGGAVLSDPAAGEAVSAREAACRLP